MDIFQQIITSFQFVPAWVTLILIPALFLVYTGCTLVVGGRRSYPFVTCACCGMEAMLTSAHGAAPTVFVCGAFVLYAAILRLLYLLPHPKKRAEKMRSERILKKLACEQPPEVAPSKNPARVCTFAEVPSKMSATERGMQLTHAETLLYRLRRISLAPSDRLEVDVLTRMLNSYGVKALTEEEMVRLNDSLTSLLKLCAKYKV